MVVEFSVGNFRSIKEMQTISFAATGLKSPSESAQVDADNIEEEGGIRLLKTIGIYGANGSGKSNVIRALVYFLQAISNEPSSQSNLGPLCDPFFYQCDAKDSASFYQIVLIIRNRKYRFGFTVKKNLNYPDDKSDSKEVIETEWLYGTRDKNMIKYFTREGTETDVEKTTENEKVPALPYKHTLYLTHEAAFDKDGPSATIRNYVKGWVLNNMSTGFAAFRHNTLRVIELENKKKDLLQLLNDFNLKYDDISIERDEKAGQALVNHDKIILSRSFINQNNVVENIKLNLATTESSGTQKLFDFIGIFLRNLDVSYSAFFIIDEIDSNFHPALLIKIIKLFNDPIVNKSHMQLIFTSHDTNLMSPSIMRRDQFYFTEKREDNSTRLYSLGDLKGIRNDADFAKQYLMGIYGAIPYFEQNVPMAANLSDGTLES